MGICHSKYRYYLRRIVYDLSLREALIIISPNTACKSYTTTYLCAAKFGRYE